MAVRRCLEAKIARDSCRTIATRVCWPPNGCRVQSGSLTVCQSKVCKGLEKAIQVEMLTLFKSQVSASSSFSLLRLLVKSMYSCIKNVRTVWESK